MITMKKILIFLFAVMSICSCRQANELPPLTEGYSSEIIVPDPENLTQADRDYLEALEKEYEQATE